MENLGSKYSTCIKCMPSGLQVYKNMEVSIILDAN